MIVNDSKKTPRKIESFFKRNRTFRRCARNAAIIAFSVLAFGSFGIEGIRCPAAYAEQSSIGKSLSSPLDEDRLDALLKLQREARKNPDSFRSRLYNPQLIKMLKDPNYEIRRDAAYVLGLSRERKAVPALIAGLGDEHYRVRESFGSALSEIGVTGGQFSRITSMFQGSKTWQEQGGAALALGNIGDLKSLPQLWEAFESAQSKIRMLPGTEPAKTRFDSAEPDISTAISMYMRAPVLEKALLDKSPSIRRSGALTVKRFFKISVGIELDDLIWANDLMNKARALETDPEVQKAMDETHRFIFEKFLAPQIRIR